MENKVFYFEKKNERIFYYIVILHHKFFFFDDRPHESQSKKLEIYFLDEKFHNAKFNTFE